MYESVQVPSPDTVSARVVPEFDKNDHSQMVLRCGDSRDLSFVPDGSVDLVLTDPPYGANVMYSELIDFFHVWNHKSSIAKEIGFAEPLSPKAQEIVVNAVQNKSHDYYQDGLTAVMAECYKKLKKNGFLAVFEALDLGFFDSLVNHFIEIKAALRRDNFIERWLCARVFGGENGAAVLVGED